ncbi:MAG: hypothetical protein A3G18_08595 [Rhodospirillales bacterium RIFCSPLOWO2_12_FULL_58_28]|nr:MAG: hypothetical protein A3H92_00150 [Rhodospirillales bacterium RIFCSPLOWO2_02_FULL_58_16]OHC79755.1 MAG: hypothetical protein A3G18_08595 [Rhodospirillales bacterium RIFCSPLOWO2_12_FULL_58_28]
MSNINLPFLQTINVGHCKIGDGHPVFLIAEAGVAHFGNPEKADRLVDLAAEAGADAFKTQAFITDDLISKRSGDWYERMRPKEVDLPFFLRMKKRCEDQGLIFLCTAHDESALRWADELEVPAYKIGSGERGNWPFLSATAKRGKPIILSTGMYSKDDVEQAISILSESGCCELALLHCVTAYPVPYAEANLGAMAELKHLFRGPVGYSDHTQGEHVSLAAVALGAKVIEKHITLDFDVPNAQDWKVSLGSGNFPDFVKRVREVEAALGTGSLDIQDCERPSQFWALKSLVATRFLAAGAVIDAAMLTAKRPGDGLPPSELPRIIGRKLAREIEEDMPIRVEDLEA